MAMTLQFVTRDADRTWATCGVTPRLNAVRVTSRAVKTPSAADRIDVGGRRRRDAGRPPSLAGHRDAFDVIVERHRRQVYQLCYRFVGNHEDASDLGQDVFIRAYRGLRGFQAGRRWARGCIGSPSTSASIAWRSRRRATEALDQREHDDLRRRASDTTLLRGERAAEVRAAIARLPRKQRATLILRVYHELPHQEIAGILGSSVGAVKANFFHALANLKKLLQ